MKTSVTMLEAPQPAMAPPTMNAAELGAAADTMDATTRINTAVVKTHFTRNCSYTFPYKNCVEHVVTPSAAREFIS